MKRVYVLVCEYHCVDSGDFANDVVGVYENFNDAKEEMEKLMVETRDDFEWYDTEESEYVDGDMTWEIWEQGEWVNHHCVINIFDRELK